ncbi:MAG: hypothetical protein JRI95_07525 [Deltaproteobacteria bacterium]|nr:hypothetical protein [Deltaproteobacteria bacterium]MBW2084668.1 hypothetical protein [Deltaproteobacteria bacterium]
MLKNDPVEKPGIASSSRSALNPEENRKKISLTMVTAHNNFPDTLKMKRQRPNQRLDSSV